LIYVCPQGVVSVVGYFDIAMRYWQFAAAPRGGLLLARGSRNPAAAGEPPKSIFRRERYGFLADNHSVFSRSGTRFCSGSALFVWEILLAIGGEMG